eukprot:PhF_6_TR7990/c0_g1_i2/m.12262
MATRLRNHMNKISPITSYCVAVRSADIKFALKRDDAAGISLRMRKRKVEICCQVVFAYVVTRRTSMSLKKLSTVITELKNGRNKKQPKKRKKRKNQTTTTQR